MQGLGRCLGEKGGVIHGLESVGELSLLMNHYAELVTHVVKNVGIINAACTRKRERASEREADAGSGGRLL